MLPGLSGPALFQDLADAVTTNYLVAAAITLLVFDHLLTVPQEVRLVWQSPWNLTSSLYVWNRYYTLIVLTINSSFMLREIDSDKFEGVSASILVNTVDVILALRVWILYEKSRVILWFFVTLISVEFLAMISLAIVTVKGLDAFTHMGSALVGCWAINDAPQLFTYYAVPTVVVSFIMFGMTIYRCGMTLFWNKQVKMPIINLFLRDGVFWLIGVLVVLAPEILTTAIPQQSRSFSELMIMPTLVVYSLIGSRVLLNIKALLANDEGSGIPLSGTFGDHTTEFMAATRTNFTSNAEP